ncbi:MAG: peptidoglycan DD-metalloendopeptidase family protein [Deltaproteobacteria bacterium]|nr:peptidoglycan DD-metalloendopeptidase family protein [Candidatus Zymogenaceae bacterium]
MWMRVGTVVLLIVMCLGRSGVAQEIQEKTKELTTIKKEIEEKRRKIREASKEEKSILSQISDMDKKLSGKEKEIVSIGHEIEATDGDITQLEYAIAGVKGRIASKQNEIGKRLVALYKLGEAGYLPVLFSATSTDDIRRRTKYLSAVIYSDRALFASFAADLKELERAMQELKGKKNDLTLLKVNADKKTLDMLREKERRTAYLSGIREKKSSYERALLELETAQKKLSSLIEKLQQEKERKEREALERAKKENKPLTPSHTSVPSGEYFVGLKGRLPYPTNGTVITKYGKGTDPKFANPVYNKGIEIKAPVGSPIISVADGEIVYSDYFMGYGNLIIVDHGDSYYTVYAHAKTLIKRVGDRVKANEKIGTVGDTGSLKGPTLYFEIRHHGNTADPELWLAAK